MARKKPDYSLLNQGCDLDNRVVWLGSRHISEDSESGVDAALVQHCLGSFYLLNKINHEPIDVLLYNPGGDTYACSAIYDCIKSSPSEVTIQVSGMAMSAASIFMQAAKTRLMSENAKLMIHYGTNAFEGHPKMVAKWVKESDKFDLWMEQVYLQRIREKHPEFKLKDLQKMLDWDTSLNAHEAIELGLADGLI